MKRTFPFPLLFGLVLILLVSFTMPRRTVSAQPASLPADAYQIVETPETLALTPQPAAVHSGCDDPVVPGTSNWTTYFDSSYPDGPPCEGTINVACADEAYANWLYCTQYARAYASNQIALADGVRWQAKQDARAEYLNAIAPCETAYILCLAIGTSIYCDTDFCECVKPAKTAYRTAAAHADAVFAAAKLAAEAWFAQHSVACGEHYIDEMAACCH